MITVGMNYSIIPGKDEEFTAVFSKVMDIMNDIEGHQKTNLYRDVWSEHEYLIVSEWSREEAFNGFINSDRFKGVADWGKANILTSRPTHEIYGTDDTTIPGTAESGGCPVHAEPEPTETIATPAEVATVTAIEARGKCPVSH